MKNFEIKNCESFRDFSYIYILVANPCDARDCLKRKKTILQLSFAGLNQNVLRLTNQIIQLNGKEPSIT